MKSSINVFKMIILFILIGIIAYFNSPTVGKFVARFTEENFTEDNIYSDIDSLSRRLDQEILNGAESFTVYLKDMDVEEINDINKSLDGIFGSGESYQQMGVIGKVYKKVNISIRRTTNYYVLQACLNGMPIPDTEIRAKELYEVVRRVLNTQIKPGMSDFEKEVALHDYLVIHCKYSANSNQAAESDIYRAYGALVNGDAVCNGYAEALQLLFMCVGIRSQFVIGTAGGVDHAWNLVELDGNWYHLDATWNDPTPDMGMVSVHPYFNVSDEVMRGNHVWNQEDYPKADHMDYNYYVKNGAYFTSFDQYKPSAYENLVYGATARYEAVIENYQDKQEDMQFVFENNNRFHSVNWQMFGVNKYRVLVIKAE